MTRAAKRESQDGTDSLTPRNKAIEEATKNYEKWNEELTNAMKTGNPRLLELENKERQSMLVLIFARSSTELSEAEGTGDEVKIARARQSVREAELSLLVCQREGELLEAEGTGDEVKIARARQRVREGELLEAEGTGGQVQIARATFNLVDVDLELSIATARKALSQAKDFDIVRCQRELDVATYALIAHRGGDGAGKFIAGKSGSELLNAVDDAC